MAQIQCCERYCERPATHYAPEKVRASDMRGCSWEVEGLMQGFCAEHAPRDARPIPKEALDAGVT